MRCFLLDPTALKTNRSALDDASSPLQAPLASLLKQAEQKLSVGAFSVTSKEIPAPSGDPNDYCHSIHSIYVEISSLFQRSQAVWAAIGGLMTRSLMVCPTSARMAIQILTVGSLGTTAASPRCIMALKWLLVNLLEIFL